MFLTHHSTYPHSKQRWWGRASERPPNTSSINTLASKPRSNELFYQQVSSHVTFVCALHHVQNRGGKGRRIAVTSSRQSSDLDCPDSRVSHSARAASWRSEAHVCPACCSRAGEADGRIHPTTGYSCPAGCPGPRSRPVSATHLAEARLPTLAPGKRGV